LTNGEVREARQGHFRGGIEDPLPAADLEAKFRANCIYGGWSRSTAGLPRWQRCAPAPWSAAPDLTILAG
jgi:hypothetical protein